MAACIGMGFSAIRRGDVKTHQAWMTRAYAIAVAAGTQVFTQGIAKGVLGTSTLTTDLALGALVRRPHPDPRRRWNDHSDR